MMIGGSHERGQEEKDARRKNLVGAESEEKKNQIILEKNLVRNPEKEKDEMSGESENLLFSFYDDIFALNLILPILCCNAYNAFYFKLCF